MRAGIGVGVAFGGMAATLDPDAAAFITARAVASKHHAQINDIAVALKAIGLWDYTKIFFTRSGMGSFDGSSADLVGFGGLNFTGATSQPLNAKRFGTVPIDANGWTDTGVDSFAVHPNYLALASGGTAQTEAQVGGDLLTCMVLRSADTGNWDAVYSGGSSIIQNGSSGQTPIIRLYNASSGASSYPLMQPLGLSAGDLDGWWQNTEGSAGQRYQANATVDAAGGALFSPARYLWLPTLCAYHTLASAGKQVAIFGESVNRITKASATTLATTAHRLVLPNRGAGVQSTVYAVAYIRKNTITEEQAAKLQAIIADITTRDLFTARERWHIAGQSNASNVTAASFVSTLQARSSYGTRRARVYHAYAGGQPIANWINKTGDTYTRTNRYLQHFKNTGANATSATGWGGGGTGGNPWGLFESRDIASQKDNRVLVWFQGENDTGNDTDAAAHAGYLRAFLNFAVADFPGLRVILALPAPESTADAAKIARYDTLRAGIVTVAAEFGFPTVDTAAMARPSGDVHLNATGITSFVNACLTAYSATWPSLFL